MAKRVVRKASQKDAEKMIESGEATIPAEAIIEKPKTEYHKHMEAFESKADKKAKLKKDADKQLNALKDHKKFDKFK